MEAKKINKLTGVVGIIGTFVTIGIIVYQTKGKLDPIIIAGIISALVTLAFFEYVVFFRRGRDK